MRIMNIESLDRLIQLRHQIHSEPELSGNEVNTGKLVSKYLRELGIKEIETEVGGTGIIVLIKGSSPGKNLLFRCELDALPIQEKSKVSYSSPIEGKAHLCGHDGHIAILIGLAELLHKVGHELRGNAFLLFQPAEETAQGANAVLKDHRFRNLNIDHAFGLHNIPGYELGSVLIRSGYFASESRGVIIRLTGTTSHAGEPEKGRSPTLAMTSIIENIMKLPAREKYKGKKVLATVIHARLGEIAFGTSPGYAEIMVTLRSSGQNEMKMLVEDTEKIVRKKARLCKLQEEIEYTEIFPAIINDRKTQAVVNEVARKLDRKVICLEHPFSWSEDFGYFSNTFPSVFFGLGAGEDHPGLHNPDYDFPDELISPGIEIFYEIARRLM